MPPKVREAFEAYYQMSTWHGSRSVAKLLTEFQRQRRETGAEVPTTNTTQIYEWSRQYRWEWICQQRDLLELEFDKKTFAHTRRKIFKGLNRLGDKALANLEMVLDDPEARHRDKLSAAVEILDRIGVAKRPAEIDDIPVQRVELPDEETEEVYQDFWLKQRGLRILGK